METRTAHPVETRAAHPVETRAAHPGRSLLATGALLLAAGLAVQWGGVEAPILTGSDHSMTQYEMLRASVAVEGTNDLVVFGNSVARQGVQPALLRRWLRHSDGRPLRAFNFAAGGSAASDLPFLADLLFGVDRPAYCVLVLTPGMLAGWREAVDGRSQALAESPYGRAIGDPLRWRGAIGRWLLDHVALFGVRYALKSALLAEPAPDRQVGGYDRRYGFVSSRRDAAPSLDWERRARALRRWEPSEERQRSLRDAVRAVRAHGAEVWLVEGPLHPHARQFLPSPESLEEMRAMLASVAAETGSKLLLATGLELQPSDFSDTSHPNARGSRKYTRWLAEGLAADPRFAWRADPAARASAEPPAR
jgi:hypothetical protein